MSEWNAIFRTKLGSSHRIFYSDPETTMTRLIQVSTLECPYFPSLESESQPEVLFFMRRSNGSIFIAFKRNDAYCGMPLNIEKETRIAFRLQQNRKQHYPLPDSSLFRQHLESNLTVRPDWWLIPSSIAERGFRCLIPTQVIVLSSCHEVPKLRAKTLRIFSWNRNFFQTSGRM